MLPWQAKLDVKMKKDKDAARKDAIMSVSPGIRNFFMDGSLRNGKVSIGIVSHIGTRDGHLIHKESAKVIGSQNDSTAHYAELAALEESINFFHIFLEPSRKPRHSESENLLRQQIGAPSASEPSAAEWPICS